MLELSDELYIPTMILSQYTRDGSLYNKRDRHFPFG